MCSHCNRENRATDADCWYCGTSLVNAPTGQITAQRVLFRLATTAGERFDVHEGEAFFMTGDSASVADIGDAPDTPDVRVRAEGGEIIASGTASLNNETLGSSAALTTGDRIEAGGLVLLVIVR
jgi:hypothetical protein